MTRGRPARAGRDGRRGPSAAADDRSAAGSGDGLPTLPSGEPVLARWFVVLLLVLVPAGVAVIVWAFTAIEGTSIPPAERRPPGDAAATHDRGEAAFGDADTTAAGPGCAAGITLVGDAGARAAGRVALSATCQLLELERFEPAWRGLERWVASGGLLRVAVFERTGLDSSTRVGEGGRLVVELNAKFQFEDAARAAPTVVHELTHLAAGMPGTPVTAPAELAAVRAQHDACQRLGFRSDPPRGCRDAAELLDDPDPLGRLVAAGYPPGR